MGWHAAFPKTTAVAGLRGATSVQKLLAHPINPQVHTTATRGSIPTNPVNP